MKRIFATTLLFLYLYTAGNAQPGDKGTFYQQFKKIDRKSLERDWSGEMKLYNIQTGMRVMDVGGSDGKLIMPLALICDSIDYSIEEINPDLLFYAPKFLALAQKNINPKANFSLHQIIGGDSVVPAGSHLFDRIIVRETFHHFDYPTQMLREFKRLLAPGGVLIISEPANQKEFKLCKLIPPQKLIEMVTSAGFKLVFNEKAKTGFEVMVYVFSL